MVSASSFLLASDDLSEWLSLGSVFRKYYLIRLLATRLYDGDDDSDDLNVFCIDIYLADMPP